MTLPKLILGGGYNLILCVGEKRLGMNEILKKVADLNLPEEKLLSARIACVPGFTLEKYRRLQRSHLSILSPECSGGIFSNGLGLKFNSPIVNLKFSERDYMAFLKAPIDYMKKELIEQSSHGCPVATLGDLRINMVHYKTFEEAATAWQRRKSRINWFNLFIMMFTESEEILREFDALPYGKKVCFVPFKSELDSAWYISPKTYKEGLTLGHMVRRFGWGEIFYYDPFDMLLYGKKTPLIEM